MRSFRGGEIVYVPNPGNAGDALIALGAYQMFDRLGLRYVTGSTSGTYENRVVVYGGGGALVDIWPGAEDFFRRNHKLCKNLILLPHTVRAHPDLWAEMDERCLIFAREPASYEYVNAHRTRSQVFCGHDLALFLGDADIARLPWSLPHAKARLSWIKPYAKLMAVAKLLDGTLRCFRTDLEATKVPIPRFNSDLSARFYSSDMSREACTNTAKLLRRIMKAYDRVETNRLHLAILAAILGKPVRMFDNIYGKNRSIFEYSVKDYFQNVVFEGS